MLARGPQRCKRRGASAAPAATARGRFIGRYRKSRIPFMDAAQSPEPRGNEKFYFSPGDLGFPTFDTPFARSAS